MTKKVKGAAQLDNLVIKEKDPNGVQRETTIRDQSKIEWEVRNFFIGISTKRKNPHTVLMKLEENSETM